MFRSLPRHAAYKSNSSPWLGDLPEHWHLARTKNLLIERSQKGYPDEPLLAATQSHGVIRKSDYETRTVTATKDLHLLKLVEVGDFVISLRSFQGGIERCYHRGIISPAYTVLTARDDLYREYLTYLFKSSCFIDSLTLAVTGIREGQNIDYSRLAVDLLPVPPAEEQAAIVKYLAHANARIDNAIAAKRRLISLLEEQQRGVVHEAIKRVAADIVPIKRAVQSMTAGLWGASPEESSDPPIWCVRVADFDYAHNAVVSAPKTLRAVNEKDAKRRSLRRGDLLLEGSGGGDKTSVGRVVLFEYEEPAVCSNFLQRLRPREGVHSGYLAHVLRDLHSTGSVRTHIKQTTGIQNLDLDAYRSILIPMPDMDSQAVICREIEESLAENDSVVDRVNHEIELIHEFRTRLVSDVVTGQVDVRALAATLPGAPGAAAVAGDVAPESNEVEDESEVGA